MEMTQTQEMLDRATDALAKVGVRMRVLGSTYADVNGNITYAVELVEEEK
jgi:hypothetical protein